MPASVGIDGYNLALARGTGVATYARTLARAVGDMGCKVDLVFGVPVPQKTPDNLREAVFFSRLMEDEGFDGRANRKVTWRGGIKRFLQLPRPREMINIPLSGRLVVQDFSSRLPPFQRLWSHGNLFDIAHRHFRRYGDFLEIRIESAPEVMHWTYPVPIRLAGAKNVYTIHDLVPFKLPHTTLDDKQFVGRMISKCISTADLICTVSDCSRKDLIELFSAPPDKVINTYQATDLISSSDDAFDEGRWQLKIRQLFDLEPGEYFLFFGAIEPKKNVGRLIEAYLSADLRRPLVIVGGRGWRSEQELKLVNGGHGRKLKAAENIVQVDYLPRALLRLLIRGARGVFFPSLYEGFGLPALEAMSLGAPLIFGDTGGLPEVAGAAGLAIDPYDVQGLTKAFERIDTDADLRARLSADGLLQADRFSMTRYQERLGDLYARLDL